MCINQLPRPCGENGKAARQHHGSLMNNLSQHCNLDETWNKWGDKSRSISLQLIYIKNSELMECKNSGSSKHVSSNQLCFHMFLWISCKVIAYASAWTLLSLCFWCCAVRVQSVKSEHMLSSALPVIRCPRQGFLSFCLSALKTKKCPNLQVLFFLFGCHAVYFSIYTQWYWFVFKSWLMALLLAKIACIKYL